MERMKKCKFCNLEFENGLKLGGHQVWCKQNPNYSEMKKKSGLSAKGRKMSNEQKTKISESRKKYLMENPHMVPYKLNHSSKISYPERYFLRVLKGFIFQYKVPGTLYEIDFANPDRKIAIEIDGDQHYLDQMMIEHDIKRDQTLKDIGWETIRIRWSHYKFLDRTAREKIIDKIMSFSLDIEKDIIFFYKFKKEKEEFEKNKKKNEKLEIKEVMREKIINSGIDFGKNGWVIKVSVLLGMKNGGGRWMRRNMPEFFKENCFERKKNAEKKIPRENQFGQNNPVYGKIWVFDRLNDINRMINPGDLTFYLEKGWEIGMKKSRDNNK